jgi:hypothetical protein
VTIYVFRDGKVAQARIYEDTAYIQTQLPDSLIDTITGRRPISDQDQLASTWRSAGRDRPAVIPT